MRAEKELAEGLGVPRAALKALRDEGRLALGEHWSGSRSGILYTPEGVEAARAALGFSEISSDFEGSLSAVVQVRISRIWPANDRRMEIVDGEAKGVLQVRTTKNFMVGMMVSALRNEGSRLYHYRGAYPRRKGRL